jgi:hypothetical protein
MPLVLAFTARGGETRTELRNRTRHTSKRREEAVVFIGWMSINGTGREHKPKSC